MPIIAQAHAELTWPPQQDVQVGGFFQVYADDRDGVVDYTTPINPSPIPCWPDGAGKIGWGMGPWGRGHWGKGAGGLRWGEGCWGKGMWGVGAPLIRHVTRPLADGTWRFAVVAFDLAGNPAAPAAGTEVSVALAGSPKPPADLAATAYDSGTDTLTLEWSLSPDDS